MKKTIIALILSLIFVLFFTLCISATDVNDSTPYTEGEIILGDVNGDGIITNADILMIYRYIYNPELYPLDPALADVDSDRLVTNLDVLKMFRYIYNSELYPLPIDLIPVQGHSTYGYKDLANNPNGEAMQELYRRMYHTSEAFVNSTNDIQSTEGMYLLDDINLSDYGLTVNEGVAVWKIFRLDNPRYYWISNTLTVSGDNLIVLIDESYSSAAYRAECDTAINNMIKEFDSLIDDGMSDLEIAMAAHDFIIGRMDYAYESDGVTPQNDIWAHNMIGCAKYGLGVCEAYAETFMFLCQRYGVDAIIVTGKSASTNEGHEWNMLKIDDVWYGVDVTWDETNENDKVSYDWFGMSGESCEVDHITDSFNSTGLDYLYRLPEMSERTFELVDMLKNGEFYGTYENIDKAFEHMTDPNADYTLNLYSYSMQASALGYYSSIKHTIYSKETPAVKSITINGVTTEKGPLGFYTSLIINDSLTSFADTLTLSELQTSGGTLYIQDNCLNVSSGYVIIPVIGNIEDGATSKIVCAEYGDFWREVKVYELDAPIGVQFRDQSTIVNLKAYSVSVMGGNLNVENLYGIYEDCNISLKDKASADIRNLYSDSNEIKITLQFGKLEDFSLLTLGNIDCNITLSLWGEVHHLVTDPFGNKLEEYVEKEDPINVTSPIAHLLQQSDFEKIKIEYTNEYDDKTSWYLVNSDGDIVLKPYSIDNGLTIIDNTVVSYDGTAEILNIPNGVTSIGEYAFQGCTSLKNVIIPDSVTNIGIGAFSGCTSLESITVPFVGESKNDTFNTHFGYIFGAPSYRDHASFIPSSVKNVIVTGGTSIAYSAFKNCTSLESVTIDGVTSIGQYAFEKCTSLVSVTIGDSVTSIDSQAFLNCTSLESLTIGGGLTSFDSSAFYGCTAIESITVSDKNPKYRDENNCLIETESKTLIFGCKSSIIPSDGSVTSIGNSAFYNCTSLVSIEIPDNVKSISNYAFYGCSSLKNVIIGDDVTSIGEFAFQYCTSLTSVTIGDGLTSVGYYAFSSCTALEHIELTDNVTNIGAGAFAYCKSLKSVENLSNVQIIGLSAFFGCTSLDGIVFHDSLMIVSDSAFAYCTALNNVYYTGTEEQWNQIYIYSDNDCLTNATIHYEYKES